MKKLVYKPRKVCSTRIAIRIDHDTVTSVTFTDGCNGNAKGLGRLLAGMPVKEAVRRLKGIRCGSNKTSCPDQLARALASMQKKRRR